MICESSITSKEISVVFQGPITQHTAEALRCARKYLPDAEIILSTWNGSSCSFPEADFILLLEDPGGVVASDSGFVDNINRMILSTRSGVFAAKRKYVLKMRTDCILRGTKFLSFFYDFPEREKDYSIFSHRILIPSFFTRPPKYKKQAYLYHPSDWVSFGLCEDMKKYWNVPLVKQPEFSQFFKGTVRGNIWSKFFAEQYVFLSCMENAGFQHFLKTRDSYTEKLAELSQHFLLNNFIILDYQTQFDFINMKYPSKFLTSKIQTYVDFIMFYKMFCDKNMHIPLKKSWKHILRVNDLIDKIYLHVFRIRKHRSRILEVLWQSIGILYYAVLICILCVLFSYRLITYR